LVRPPLVQMLAPDKGRVYDLCWKHDLGKTLREA
jgi:hypothetical protein